MKIRNLANVTVLEREDAIAFLIVSVLLNCKWQRVKGGMSGVTGSRVTCCHLLRGERVWQGSAWWLCWLVALPLHCSLWHTCENTHMLHDDPALHMGS